LLTDRGLDPTRQTVKMMRAQLQQQQQQPAPNGDAVPVADASAPAHAPTVGSGTDTDSPPPLRNRAGESQSPYVRRHADTPVAWQPLDEATLEYSTRENKPIFMHIGFLADHRELAIPLFLCDPEQGTWR
jgi:hypothetical protein